MEFYRAETLIENLQEHTDKENEQSKKEEKQYEKGLGNSSASDMMRNAQNSLPKFSMPSMPSFNPGNFKL